MMKPQPLVPNRLARIVSAAALTGVLTAMLLPTGVAAQKPRKGFVLNLGLGAAGVSMSSEAPGSRQTKAGVGTDFKIGYAPTDQWLVYYSSDAAFYTETSPFGDDDQLVSVGVSGIGVTHFLQPAAPSLYVEGAIGLAAMNRLSFDDATVDGIGGWGLAFGGGYEFARHFLVDADVVIGKLDGGLNTTTLRVGLIWLLY